MSSGRFRNSRTRPRTAWFAPEGRSAHSGDPGCRLDPSAGLLQGVADLLGLVGFDSVTGPPVSRTGPSRDRIVRLRYAGRSPPTGMKVPSCTSRRSLACRSRSISATSSSPGRRDPPGHSPAYSRRGRWPDAVGRTEYERHSSGRPRSESVHRSRSRSDWFFSSARRMR